MEEMGVEMLEKFDEFLPGPSAFGGLVSVSLACLNMEELAFSHVEFESETGSPLSSRFGGLRSV